jgi:excisionase family DNA binding protein
MDGSDDGEVVATRRRRKIKPRSKWRTHKRPGGGELLNIQELAAALGESVRTVRNWQHKGGIPYLRLGHRSIRFRLFAVLEALEKKTVKRRFFYQQHV